MGSMGQISINLVLVLLLGHWIADFICQTDRMAKGKSSDWAVLTEHVTAYTMVMLSVVTIYCTWKYDWFAALPKGVLAVPIDFVLLNGMLHFCIDAVTSRVTSRLWKAQQVHWFFVVIGFDQLLHVGLLVWLAGRMGL